MKQEPGLSAGDRLENGEGWSEGGGRGHGGVNPVFPLFGGADGGGEGALVTGLAGFPSPQTLRLSCSTGAERGRWIT